MKRRLKLLGSPVHKMALRDKGCVISLLADLSFERKLLKWERYVLKRFNDVYTVISAGEVVEDVRVRRVVGIVELVVNGVIYYGR